MKAKIIVIGNKQYYKYWEILEELPKGWFISKNVSSPLTDCVFITDAKSPLFSKKRALLKIKK